MNRCVKTLALVMIVGLTGQTSVAEFSYSYLEVTGDLSSTRNTGPAPLKMNASGKLFGIEGSWQVSDRNYVKGAWSTETKEFSNLVAGTPLDLNSKQTVTSLSFGHVVGSGERTNTYAEMIAIAHLEVDHLVPVVIPSTSGPPTVTTTQSIIEGNGLGAAFGIRYRVFEHLELEGRLSHIQTRGDVKRTGAKISDHENIVRLGGHYHWSNGISVGGFLSLSKHTDPNFDNIRKLGLAMRYNF